MNLLSRLAFLLLSLFIVTNSWAQAGINGHVIDKKTKEPLIGATVLLESTKQAVKTDINGEFHYKNLKPGIYNLTVTFVSYSTQKVKVTMGAGNPIDITIEMDDAGLELKGVEVVARRRTDTELSMLKSVKASLQVVSGVSSQQITKTLDRDASEVVKRIPGVTIQDNRFVVVRGLNQRYNNVWLNNAATPSSETDVKAFSFDAIPSNMIDNMMIYKTGSPELPGEATGGFIKIFTKNIPEENFSSLEYSIGYNDQSSFKDTYHLKTHVADVLGLGSSARNIPAGFPSNLNNVGAAAQTAAALKLGNNWIATPTTALPNQKLSFTHGRKWKLGNEAKLGTLTSLTYNNSYSTRSGMQNNMYEGYDEGSETPNYSYQYKADIYTHDVRVGFMHNWAYEAKNGNRIEFKNILNQIGMDKSANTLGYNTNRGGNFNYFSNQYSSRTTYSGQLCGLVKMDEEKAQKLDWNAGFSYANRIEPNRQNWSMKENSDGQYLYQLPVVASINELGRLYLTNHEYVSTAAANYEQKLKIGNVQPTLKTGGYFEYKSRDYSERSICYKATNASSLTDAEINALSFETLFTEPYLGTDKVLTVVEETNLANKYDARNMLGAGYLALNVPLSKLNVYGGVRAEYNHLTLNGYYDAITPVNVNEPSFHLFPSVNASYNITDRSLFRLAYAQTINRPEFREISSFTYYDFTEKYTIKGNPKLKDCEIQNIDLRFEHYPTPNETFSVAAFYKHFSNPIEMISIGTGSNFSFANAVGATNYGLELEIKKSLAMIGLKNFSLNMNTSLIYSNVDFASSETERSRPLQGQSPYVVNAGLYYQNDKAGISSSLMYNVMGKRIIVAAELNQGTVVTPDIYEMERHVVDFSFNKKLSKKLELKLGIKDLLSQNIKTQQTYEYTKNGETKSATVTNKSYNPGRTIQLGINWKL